jgi:hypothetical protein
MITEIVTFKLPAGSKREDVFAAFEKTAPVWANNPDLVRKNYLYDADAGIAGGVYLWKEKAHALKWHGEEFRQRVKQLYGATPTSQFFETPIVVDNAAGEITTDHAGSVAA